MTSEQDRFYEREFKRGLKQERQRKGVEALKVRDGVFDKATLMVLYDLIKAGHLATVEGIVSTGKEANIFWGTTPGGETVAIKIYRIAAATFRNMWQYLIQDPRFKSIKKHHRHVVFGWAKREYKNLMRIEGDVPVPHPHEVRSNVLVMEFLGRDGVPYPRLKEQGSDDPEGDLEALITYMKKMYEAGIVHGDLSEYNVLVSDEGLIVIDLSQGTVVENTLARDFLERDIENVLRYFSKYMKVPSKEDVYDRITGGKDGE